jgi:6,7-dimethyl-8-ribityllumazine synthase
MSSKDKNLSTVKAKSIDLSNANIGVITADWNEDITYALRDACIKTLVNTYSADIDKIISHSVPGAFELPVAAKLMLANQNVDAVICIGCVIKGETKHDEYISNAVASGIMNLSIMASKPVIFGVLTPNSMEQAKDRTGGAYGNKGDEAAHTCAKMIDLAKEIKNPNKKSIGFNA